LIASIGLHVSCPG